MAVFLVPPPSPVFCLELEQFFILCGCASRVELGAEFQCPHPASGFLLVLGLPARQPWSASRWPGRDPD